MSEHEDVRVARVTLEKVFNPPFQWTKPKPEEVGMYLAAQVAAIEYLNPKKKGKFLEKLK